MRNCTNYFILSTIDGAGVTTLSILDKEHHNLAIRSHFTARIRSAKVQIEDFLIKKKLPRFEKKSGRMNPSNVWKAKLEVARSVLHIPTYFRRRHHTLEITLVLLCLSSAFISPFILYRKTKSNM